jgi:hypothetical protein
MLDDITEAKIQRFLHGIADSMNALSREALKDLLCKLIGQITHDPATHECQIDYRIAVDPRNKMASPRAGHLIPRLWATSETLHI